MVYIGNNIWIQRPNSVTEQSICLINYFSTFFYETRTSSHVTLSFVFVTISCAFSLKFDCGFSYISMDIFMWDCTGYQEIVKNIWKNYVMGV